MPDSVVYKLLEVAAERPDACALRWHASVWTYSDVESGALATATLLRSLRVKPGDRVGLLLRNSPQYIAAYLGVLAASAVAVPLNVQERSGVLLKQLEHSRTRLLLGDPEHPEWRALTQRMGALDMQSVAVQLYDGAGAPEFFRNACQARPHASIEAPKADDLAAIVYTSGTTGRPKGVMLSQGNLASNAAAIVRYLGLGPDDHGLCVLPFHFSYGSSVWQSHLWAGAQLSIEDNLAFPHLTLRRIADEAISGFAGVPSTFALLLRRCALSDYKLDKLRYVTQAGGAMSRMAIAQLQRQLPQTRIFIMYGQTEATARLSFLPPEKLDDKIGSVGLPIPGVEIEVHDATGAIVPAGEVGEICARGPNIMLGYWDDVEATALALRAGWLHTGDLGHMDSEGYLYIDGRASDMIKVGAFRVSPMEVEEVVAAIPGVQEAAAVGIDDELLGQAVCVVIVAEPGVELHEREIRAHCRAQLAAYKVPKVVKFSAVLPRTASGKVQRFKLTNGVQA